LSVDEAVTRLYEAGAPAAPVLELDDTYTHAFLEENNFYESYDDPAFGPAKGVAMFARFSRTDTGFRRPAPTIGEHTEEVLRDFGLSRDRLDV
jgi:crotonobetainyl-CoA:carnitine CoA-transferase CaiB-like acyl-CoA transferase